MADKTEKQSDMKERPPVVVVMGHVDHGKTTLLDYIRKANVAAKEAGGITQAISAYEIVHSGKKITFIDTPGHEAFTKMRSRGATAADLAIVVVAADEGIKPQTLEAVHIAESAKTPFVVAMNKVDKAGANIEKLKNDLTAAGVLLEGYGGTVSYQPISAKTGEGVPELLDLLLLAAEFEHLQYDPTAAASGFVLEARVSGKRGLEAEVIVKNGILKRAQPIATATAQGKIKILENFLGSAVQQLEPCAPALIVGFETLPSVGEEFTTGSPALSTPSQSAVAVRNATRPGYLPEEKGVALILKASDSGSLEALSQIVKALPSPKPLDVVSEGVGDVTDTDVKLAVSTGAVVVGFKSKVHKAAAVLAQGQSVTIVTSEIVYELVKAVEDFISGASTKASIGELEVLAVFNQQKLDKQLVGGKVLSGMMKIKARVHILRGQEVAGQGRISSLREQKKEVTVVTEGKECGVLLSAGLAVAVGDTIAIFPEG